MSFKYLLVVISTWVTQSSFATDGEKVTEIFNSANFSQTCLSKSIFKNKGQTVGDKLNYTWCDEYGLGAKVRGRKFVASRNFDKIL